MICDAWNWLIDPINLTAVSTGIIAVFTVALSIVGWRQASLTNKAIVLAREEFVASHRPKIIVRSVTFMLEGAGQNPVGQRTMVRFELANIGGSHAKIVGTKMVIDFLTGGQLRMVSPPEVGQFALPGWDGITLAAGECRPDCWYGNPETHFDADMIAPYSLDHGLFFCGHVLYEDGNKILRRTSFCRRFEPSLGYWPASIHYDYEHAD